MSGSRSKHREDERRRKTAESLSHIVEQEARRLLSAEQLEGDPARIADGWERRFIADAQRATEAVELYARLGYEVCADPIKPEEVGEDCGDCLLLAALQFKVIYTRRRHPGSK